MGDGPYERVMVYVARDTPRYWTEQTSSRGKQSHRSRLADRFHRFTSAVVTEAATAVCKDADVVGPDKNRAASRKKWRTQGRSLPIPDVCRVRPHTPRTPHTACQDVPCMWAERPETVRRFTP